MPNCVTYLLCFIVDKHVLLRFLQVLCWWELSSLSRNPDIPQDIDDAKYIPIVMLGPDQRAKVNYGQDPHSLKYYTCCGLQEGYEPFCM